MGPGPAPPPGSSPPTWSPTPRGRSPAASRPRRTATAGPSGASSTRRWPPTPGGWPTATAGRFGSCGPVRTWCARAQAAAGGGGDRRRRHRGPPGRARGGPAAAVDGGPGADAWAQWSTASPRWPPGWWLEAVAAGRAARLLRPPGRGVGRGGGAGRLRPGAAPTGADRRPGATSRRGDAPGRRSGGGPLPVPTARSRWWSTRARSSTRWCCAPTPSVPPTRPWAGCDPRGSPSTTTASVRDLTVRSFGILRARAMPPVEVTVSADRRDRPVNGSDAVFAAVAAARWLADGLPGRWPTDRPGAGRR